MAYTGTDDDGGIGYVTDIDDEDATVRRLLVRKLVSPIVRSIQRFRSS